MPWKHESMKMKDWEKCGDSEVRHANAIDL